MFSFATIRTCILLAMICTHHRTNGRTNAASLVPSARASKLKFRITVSAPPQHRLAWWQIRLESQREMWRALHRNMGTTTLGTTWESHSTQNQPLSVGCGARCGIHGQWVTLDVTDLGYAKPGRGCRIETTRGAGGFQTLRTLKNSFYQS